MAFTKHPTAVLLHNVRSAHNVGSILRTADAAGAVHVYLSGYTPMPVDRFGRMRSDVAKAALGAEQTVLWSHHKRAPDALRAVRADGFCAVAVEQAHNAKDYRTFNIERSTCFVFGNEVRGLSSSILKQCDAAIEIPMQGIKESLNVSVAVGIILFGVC